MRKLSIRVRLIALSVLLLGALTFLGVYFAERMFSTLETLSEEASAFAVLKSANTANRAFGDLKFGLTQRIIRLSSSDDDQAAVAREALEEKLTALADYDAETIAVVNLELGAALNTTEFAIEAYTEDQRNRGDWLRAKSLEHVAVIDRRLQGLVELLEIESTRQREATIAATRRTVRNSLVALGVLAVLGFALTLWIVRSITVPLGELVESIRRITAGELDAPIPPPGGDEIGVMTRTLSLFRASVQERNVLAENNQRADAAIHATRARFAEAIESVSEGFILFDKDDRLVMHNRQYLELAIAGTDVTLEPGATFEDIARSTARSGVIVDAHGRVEEWVLERLREHKDPSGPRLQQRSGGRWLQVNERTTGDGGTVAVFMDVTELKQREEQLAIANREKDGLLTELHAVLECIDNGVLLLDGDLTVRFANRAYRALWGFPDEFFSTHPTLDEEMAFAQSNARFGVAPDAWPAHRLRRLEQIRNGVPVPEELSLPGERYLQWKCVLLPDGGRMLSYFDITELKHRQKELAAANQEKDATLSERNAVLDAIEYGVLFMDEDLRIRLTNNAYRRIWNLPETLYTRTTSLKDDMWASRDAGAYDVDDAEWEEYFAQRVAEIRAGDIDPVDMSLANGKVLRYQCVSLPRGGRMLTYFDITELKRVERALRESEERYALSVRGSNDGLWDWNAATDQIFISPRFKSITGLTTSRDIVTPAQWKEVIHPEDRAEHAAQMAAHLKGETSFFSSEYRVRGNDEVYRWIHNRGVCVRDGDGRVYRMAGSLSDITERKEAEIALRAAKEQAEDATRVKSQFIANMSHELRTPLNAVIGLAEMLEEEASEEHDEERLEPVRRIVLAARHLLHLISEILDLSKIEAGRLDIYTERFAIRDLIEELRPTVEQLSGQNSNRLTLSCDDAIGYMHSDVTRVRQILLNLLSNSCKFTHGGEVSLHVSSHGDMSVSFMVQDNGIGMSSGQLERLFDEFSQADSSTTRRYGGTGLGLSISRRICDLLNGVINVESELDVGTSFTVVLPRVHGQPGLMGSRTDTPLEQFGTSINTAGS